MSRWLAASIRPVDGDVYIGVQLLQLNVVETKDVPTMAVDGKSLFYNAEFVAGLSDRKGESIVIHEGWHIALGHCLTRGNRDPRLWNIACDLAINSYLMSSKYDISGGCIPTVGKYAKYPAGKSAEWYFAELAKDPPPPSQGGGAGGSGDGEEGEVKDHPQAGTEDAARDWEAKQIAAANAAKQAGSVPGHMEELLGKLLTKPKIPWHILLRRFLERSSPSGYTYAKFNRRFPEGINGCRLPAVSSVNTGDMVFAIDTSGSMTSEDLAKGLAEVDSLLAKIHGSTCRIIQCDTEIHEDKVFTAGDSPLHKRVKMKGRGGTSFRPVFDAIRKHPPRCLIYMTDGCGDWNSIKKPNYPVLWVITSGGDMKPPFGKAISLA